MISASKSKSKLESTNFTQNFVDPKLVRSTSQIGFKKVISTRRKSNSPRTPISVEVTPFRSPQKHENLKIDLNSSGQISITDNK